MPCRRRRRRTRSLCQHARFARNSDKIVEENVDGFVKPLIG